MTTRLGRGLAELASDTPAKLPLRPSSSPFPLRVELHWFELNLALELARVRHEQNMRAGVQSELSTNERSAAEVTGALGEVVASRALNLAFDARPAPQGGTTDFRLHSGHTLDVKSTWHPKGNLLVPAQKDRDAAARCGKGARDVPAGCSDIHMLVRLSLAPSFPQWRPEHGYVPGHAVRAVLVGWAWNEELVWSTRFPRHAWTQPLELLWTESLPVYPLDRSSQ